MGHLTRNEILAANDLKFEEVGVPQWGGTVRVYGLTSQEKDEWQSHVVRGMKGDGSVDVDPQKAIGQRHRLVARCLRDEQGARLFTDEQIEELGSKNAQVIDEVLYPIATRLSGIGEEGEDAAGKPSPPSDDSSSGSASSSGSPIPAT